MFLFYLADFYLKSIREIFTRFPLIDRKFYFHEISKFETNIIYNTYIKGHFCCVYLNNIRYNKFKNFIYILWKIIKKIYRIKIERAKEGEGILSREEDAQQIADLSSAMQMLYLRRKYQAKKRTGTSGSRKFVDGAPWFINEKFDPVVTERPALISSENPARNSKNSNSTSTRSPSRENCQTAILVTHRLVFAPIPSSPSPPSIIPHYSKKKSPSFVFYDTSSKGKRRKILLKSWQISRNFAPSATIDLRHHVPILRNFSTRCEIFLES